MRKKVGSEYQILAVICALIGTVILLTVGMNLVLGMAIKFSVILGFITTGLFIGLVFLTVEFCLELIQNIARKK